MGKIFAAGVQVVRVTNRLREQYWAAAVPREKAVEAVLEVAAPGSRGMLTNRRLTPEQVAELELRANEVRELKHRPRP